MANKNQLQYQKKAHQTQLIYQQQVPLYRYIESIFSHLKYPSASPDQKHAYLLATQHKLIDNGHFQYQN
jgi:hypothetical protein